jgi:hypothetical protein
MRRQVFAAAAVLLSACNNGLAQTSAMGSTAMGLPSTPGAIVSSPLNGPSPFSAATEPGAPDTTLAPVPLASDPTMAGTVVNCSVPLTQLASGIPAALVPPMGSVPLGTVPTAMVRSTTGTISLASPPGSASTTGCSATPGGSPSNGAALPLSTPEIQDGLSLGAIGPEIGKLAGTSIGPSFDVVPTPNSASCRESVTMILTNPGMMPPANATGATGTPGVSSPSGC